MPSQPDLIYDVGVCHGDDSAYYLHKGYRVVGIEPHPLLIERLRERFRSEIADGRYQLVPTAIAGGGGEKPFWVCDKVPGWSSFDRAIAGYGDSRHHAVSVETCSFASILERFGAPYYCKIDIEGSDEMCLRDLTPENRPEYLSIEIPLIGTGVVRGEGGARLVARLEQLGYCRFKIISQVTFRQPTKAAAAVKARMPGAVSRVATALQERLRRYGRDGDWRFSDECSGPFGEASCGKWLEAAAATDLSRKLESNDDISDWFDLHAAAGIG